MSEFIWLDATQPADSGDDTRSSVGSGLAEWLAGRSADAPDPDDLKRFAPGPSSLTFVLGGRVVEERAADMARALGRRCIFVDRGELLLAQSEDGARTAAIWASAQALHIVTRADAVDRSRTTVPLDAAKLDRLIAAGLNRLLVERTGRDLSRVVGMRQISKQLEVLWEEALGAEGLQTGPVAWPYRDETLEISWADVTARVAQAGKEIVPNLTLQLAGINAVLVPAALDARLQVSLRSATGTVVRAVTIAGERAIAERLGPSGLLELPGTFVAEPTAAAAPRTDRTDGKPSRARSLPGIAAILALFVGLVALVGLASATSSGDWARMAWRFVDGRIAAPILDYHGPSELETLRADVGVVRDTANEARRLAAEAAGGSSNGVYQTLATQLEGLREELAAERRRSATLEAGLQELRSSLEEAQGRLPFIERRVGTLLEAVDRIDTEKIDELDSSLTTLGTEFEQFRIEIGTRISSEVGRALDNLGPLTVTGSLKVRNPAGRTIFSVDDFSGRSEMSLFDGQANGELKIFSVFETESYGAFMQLKGARNETIFYAGPSTNGSTLLRTYGQDGSRFLNVSDGVVRLENGRGNDILFAGPSTTGATLFHLNENGGSRFLDAFEDSDGGGGLRVTTSGGRVSLVGSTRGNACIFIDGRSQPVCEGD